MSEENNTISLQKEVYIICSCGLSVLNTDIVRHEMTNDHIYILYYSNKDLYAGD
jgi:hypothetical protein